MEEKPLKVKRGESRVHTDVPMKTPSGSSNHELPDPVPAAGQVLHRTIGPDPVGAAVPHEDWFHRGVPTWDGQDGRKAGWKNSPTLTWRSRPRSARPEVDLLISWKRGRRGWREEMKDREEKTRDGEEKTKAWDGRGRVTMATLRRMTPHATILRRCTHQGLQRKGRRAEGKRGENDGHGRRKNLLFAPAAACTAAARCQITVT